LYKHLQKLKDQQILSSKQKAAEKLSKLNAAKEKDAPKNQASHSIILSLTEHQDHPNQTLEEQVDQVTARANAASTGGDKPKDSSGTVKIGLSRDSELNKKDKK